MDFPVFPQAAQFFCLVPRSPDVRIKVGKHMKVWDCKNNETKKKWHAYSCTLRFAIAKVGWGHGIPKTPELLKMSRKAAHAAEEQNVFRSSGITDLRRRRIEILGRTVKSGF